MTRTDLPTLRTRVSDGVMHVEIDAPPINLVGPELVRDFVALLTELETDTEIRVVILGSANEEFFIPHVDMTKVPEYTAEAGKAGGPYDASLGMLWRKLSLTRPVTIAKIRGRARGAGSELALACDMRFISRERGVIGQPEMGFGAPPGAGGVQHLARLLGRGRAMEAILGAADLDADTAERYGWVNRALPDSELDGFVAELARRIASFPAVAVQQTKQVLNAITLSSADDVRSDARRFQLHVGSSEVQERASTLFARGLQQDSAVERDLGAAMGEL